MSLKAIELQVALPRTYEAGKVSEQVNQRSQLANDYAALEGEKKLEEARQNVPTLEAKDKAALREDGKGQERQQKRRDSGKDEESQAVRAENHPYKGKSIDYNG